MIFPFFCGENYFCFIVGLMNLHCSVGTMTVSAFEGMITLHCSVFKVISIIVL